MPSKNKKTTRPDPSDQRVVLVSKSLRRDHPPAAAGTAGSAPDGERASSASGVSDADTGATVPPDRIGAELPAARRRESFWAEVASWSVIFFAVIVGVSILGWFYWTGDSRASSSFFLRLLRPRPQAEITQEPPAEPERRRSVDGLPLSADAIDTGYVGVMIENMIDSRPLAGLAEAILVIEAPVEGGITRFLALYPPGAAVSRIGPVRSARPYYLDWAQEYDVLYAHVGGSPEALDKIRQIKLRDLNQFSWGKYFWRDTARSAPHNVYTSSELLAKASDAAFADYRMREPAPRKFKDDPPEEDRPADSVDLVINYSTPSYRVTWKYDRRTNDYARWQGDDEQRDESGTPVRAKNIVVQYSQIRILDEIGRRRIETLGEGPALLALDGKTFAAVWKKPTVAERTRYFDESGAEVALNAGVTWVEIVPAGASIAH